MDRTNHVEKLERIMEQLADSVLEVSDEALLAEISESGADPQQEAERTRLVLRQAAMAQEVKEQRLSKLGDSTNSNYGRTGKGPSRSEGDQYTTRSREASR